MTALASDARPVLRYRPSRFRTRVAGLLAMAVAVVAPAVLAADLQVSPISLEFSPREQAQGLWLSNTGTAPLRAQVRVQRWSQADGVDQLAATRDLTASPPILEIAPGQSQLVRIVKLQPTPSVREQSYRLLVDELPGDNVQQTTGLQFLLRYSIPVFVMPQGTAPVEAGKPAPMTDISLLSTRIRGAGKDATLEIDNRGNRRVRISQLSYMDGNGNRAVLAPGLLGYVLAGQTMRWPLALPESAQPGGTLQARFNNDPEEQSLSPVTTVR